MPYNKSVRAFCEVDGNLWIGTKGSGIINIPHFGTGQSFSDRQYFLAPAELDNNSVYALKKGNDELIYIGSDAKGIGVYDLKSKRFYKWADIKGYAAILNSDQYMLSNRTPIIHCGWVQVVMG